MKLFRILPLLVLAFPFLVAFRLLADVVGIHEPWATLLFAVVAPLIVQAIGRIAPAASDLVYQIAALVLTVIFVALSGGFAGLQIPVFPALPSLSGDVGAIIAVVLAFLGALLTYLAGWLRVLLAAWGSVEISYRLVLKWFMEKKLHFDFKPNHA